MVRTRLSVLLAALGVLAPLVASAGPPGRPSTWFSAWSRPQSVVVGAAADPLDGGRGPGPLVDQTVRDVVRVTGSGSALRLRLSDRYGAALSPDATTALHVLAATVARRSAGAALVAGSARVVSFGRRPDVTVPAGATAVSDPVALPVSAGEDLAVSLHVELSPVAPQHGASFVTSYLAPTGSGDHTRDVDGGAFTQETRSTLVLTGVDVRSDRLRGVVAATGGSVVDGFGTETDTWQDWPSWLSRRIGRELPAGRQLTVVNNGLGGTTAAAACALPGTGPSVEERVAHDSLQLPGLTTLIVYAGTNDLGDGCGAAQIVAGLRSVVRQAHARGVRVLVSTITPRGQYTALQNAEREKVNAWVRGKGSCSGECDRSLDFDRVVRDPADPNRIDPSLDSGDGVHPNGEGYRRIAASVPLSVLG